MTVAKMATKASSAALDSHWEEEVISAISREVVRLHVHHFGSCPRGAETFWHDDFLICTVDEALTAFELTLIEQECFDRVRADRRALHDVLEPTYRALVESLTGRAVRAYMSEVEARGVAFEAFILEH